MMKTCAGEGGTGEIRIRYSSGVLILHDGLDGQDADQIKVHLLSVLSQHSTQIGHHFCGHTRSPSPLYDTLPHT